MRTSVIAGLAVLCAAAWLSLNLWGNNGGHISGLFYPKRYSTLVLILLVVDPARPLDLIFVLLFVAVICWLVPWLRR